MQNSALSFSVCGIIKAAMLNQLIEILSENYIVRYNERVDLLSIRHYKNFDLPEIVKKIAHHINPVAACWGRFEKETKMSRNY